MNKTIEEQITEAYTKTEIMKAVDCTYATASKWHDNNSYPIYAQELLGVTIEREFKKIS